MKEEIRQKLTGAVIGLARTCENNEKTENTNRVFLEALTVAGDWSASIFDMSEMLEKVRNEKYTVSPGCVTCATPFVTGSAALLMEWGIVRGNDPYLYGEKVKAYLRRGAKKVPGFDEYPNEEVGYGALCTAQSIPQI